MNISASLILLGIYYGLLTTFPVGPSQLVSVRTFLLEGKGKNLDVYKTIQHSKILITTISGIVISKIIILISIYFTPVSSFLIKPFSSSIFLFLYISFYWRRISFFNRELLVREEQSFNYINILSVSLDIILVQILNPFIFPTPVLKRLLNVFLFRYSQMPFFLSGIVIGWLSGQILFIFLTYFLLIRLEKDTGILYQLLKIMMHRIFPPIFLTMCFLFLGKIPLSLIGKNINIKEKNLQDKIYSNLFVYPNEIKRPLRLIDESVLEEEIKESVLQEKTEELVLKEKTEKTEQSIQNTEINKTLWNKKNFSQYIFEACVSDGKRKLSYTYPKGLLVAERKFKTSLGMPQLSENEEIDISAGWILNKTFRKKQLSEILLHRMELLDKGTCIDQILEKQLISLPIASQDTEQTLFKKIDARLNFKNQTNNFLFSEDSSWLSAESDLLQFQDLLRSNIFNISKIPNELELINPENKIKNHLNIKPDSFDLSNSYQNKNNKQNTIESLEMYKPMPYWENNEIRIINARSHIFQNTNNTDFFRKNIIRNLLTNSLQSQRRKTLIWNLTQERVKTPLILRVENLAIQKTVENLWSLFSFQQKNQKLTNSISKKNINRPKIRSLPLWARYLRNLSLIVESLLRKYLTLPILICIKNGISFILFQEIEWAKDWSNWKKETYEYHSFEGVVNQFPKLRSWIFSKSNCEIKIKNPFRLKLLEPSLYGKDPYYENSSYLTIWGNETHLPFDKIKQQPAFFKPILKIFGLNLKAMQLILKREINKIVFEIKQIQKNLFISQDTENIPKNLLTTNNQKSQLSTESLTNDTLIKNNKSINLIPIESSLQTEKGSLITSNLNDPFSTGIISYLKTDCVNIQKEIENIQNKLNKSISIESTYNAKVVHKNLFNQYSVLGRAPIEINLNKHKILKIRIFSKESKASIWYKYFQLKNQIIEIDRTYSKYITKGNKAFLNFFHVLKQNSNKTNFKLLQLTRQIIKKYKYNIVQIRRNLINTLDNFYFYFVNNISFLSNKKDHKSYKKEYMSKDIVIQSNTLNGLSQAVIFHKIWQTKIVNTFHLNSFISLWNSKKYLENDFQNILKNQGIFNENNPTIFTKDNWQEWINEIPRYTPSSKVWVNICPKIWNIQIEDNFKKDETFQIYLKQQNNQAIVNSIGKEFSYHKALLLKANKLLKRWKFDLILQNYINYEKTNDNTYQKLIQLDQIKINATKESQTSILNNVEIQNSLINNESNFNNNFEWGSARVRQERFAPYLPFSLEDTEFDKIDTNTSFISKEKSEVSIIDDEKILRNIISPFFRFINRQEDKFILNITELLLSDLLLEGFIPENIFLLNKMKELRVLESLDISKSLNQYENIIKPNDVPRNPSVVELDHLFLLKNIYSFYGFKKNKSPLSCNQNDNLKYDRILKRLLWPVHHLEDLACINRFSIDSSNQSRFSTLRIKMYPSIHS